MDDERRYDVIHQWTVVLQVTEEVYAALRELYEFRCRGRVSVKGKGEMITYFLHSRKLPDARSMGGISGATFQDPRRSPLTPDSPSLARPPSRESWDGVMRQGSGYSLRQGSLTSQSKSPVCSSVSPGLERQPSMDSGRANLGTPPGSLNKKRQCSVIDSPRTASRKLSGSSGTNPLSNENHMRTDPPELPAIHYMNIKMHSSSHSNTPPGRARHSLVQNSLFDSLKETNNQPPTSPSLSPANSLPSNGDDNGGSPQMQSLLLGSSLSRTIAESGSVPSTSFSRPLASPPASNRSSVASIQPLRRVNSDLATKPPTPPSSHSSPSIVSQMPNQGGGQFARSSQMTLGSGIGVSPIRQQVLKAPQEEMIPEDPVLAYNQDNTALLKELPPKEILPGGNMTRDLGQAISQNSPNRPHSKHTKKPRPLSNGYSSRNGNEVLFSQNGATSSKNDNSTNNGTSEERFVRGVYREPLHKSQSTTPSQRSSASSNKSTVFTGTADPIHDLSPSPTKSRPLSDVRRSSSGSKESNSSGSTLTPTASALVVSIDGKMMSILPPASGDAPLPIRRVNADDYGSAANGVKSDWGGGRLILSPKFKRQSFPSASYGKRDYASFTSDDERESISSRQMSDHSSIVLLQPIELKPSKNAFVRSLACDGKTDGDLLNYIFGSPFHSLDRVISRSSDTINSIPRCPPTPKFPVPATDSSSLTQLLHELTGQSSPMTQEITPSPRFGRSEDLRRTNGPGVGTSLGDWNSSRLRGNGISAADAERRRRHRLSAVPLGNPGDRQSISNPYQVKRRTTCSMPPRHCRSLDYIPSDRDEAHASNTSSTCGSPKVYNKRHSYLLPLIFGQHHAPPTHLDTISLSSLASSSEMSSHSDPAIHTHDSGSTAYESEYDNYRPGVVSDDDFYPPDPVSDVDFDLLDVDDINVDDLALSDRFSLDMPVPRFQKKITDV